MKTPEGWRAVPLGAIATESKERVTPCRGIARPYVGLEHITPGVPIVDRMATTEAVTSAKTVFRPDDVLFGKLRPYLRKVAMVDIDGVCSTDILAIRADKEVAPSYLLALLSSEPAISHAVDNSAGTKMPRTSWKLMAGLKVLLPPLPEQRKIAEILGSVDESIRATKAVIEQTKKVKKGLLQQLLTRGIGHTRFKQTEIGEIPESWEVVRLGDVVERIGVGIASSATHAYASTGIPLLRNQNIKESWLDTSDLLYVSSEYDNANKSKRVSAGDVITVRTGNPGVSAVVPKEFDGCQTFTTLVCTPSPTRLNSDYLCWWTNSEKARSFVLKGQAGAAQKNFNVGEYRQMPIGLPCIEEQTQIADRLNDTRRSIRVLEDWVVRLARMKTGLMQDLLTGKVRV